MNTLITAEIDTLPPLPQTITELQCICVYEDTTIKQVADVIEKDPFLTEYSLHKILPKKTRIFLHTFSQPHIL